MTRGIRNQNPGNIRATSIDWDGTAAFEDRTEEQKNETSFVVFRGPWWGIRAMAKILRNYQTRHELNTIAGIVDRWAPGHENPTHSYVDFVAERMGVGKHATLHLDDFETMWALVEALIRFENGKQPYTWEIDAGLIMAGIEPEQPEYA